MFGRFSQTTASSCFFSVCLPGICLGAAHSPGQPVPGIGCSKCVELCPLNNIHLENGKPVWGKNCTHCMACICYCPKEAIEYGKKSRNKPRYHFEALEKKQDV